MVLSTSTLRVVYAPACTAKGAMYSAAYKALDSCLKVYNYRPRSGVTGAYNCRKITGGTGYSLHAYGPGSSFTFWTGVKIAMSLAVDINWDKNPYGPRLVTDMPRAMIDAVYRIRTNSGAQVWRWGGYYTGNKDAMHFEIVCSKADLASGINPTTLPTYSPPAPTLEWKMQTLDFRTASAAKPVSHKHVDNMKLLMVPWLELGGRKDLADALLASHGPVGATKTKECLGVTQDILAYVGLLRGHTKFVCGAATWKLLIEG